MSTAARAFIAFVIIPNALLYLLGLFFFTNRALINLDYLALAMLWPWLRGWLRIALFTLVFLVDVVTATGSMYNINPVAGIDALTRAPIGLLLTVLAALLIAIALAIGLARTVTTLFQGRPSRSMVISAIVFAIAIFIADGLLLGNPFIERRTSRFTDNVATSSVARFAWDLRDRARAASADFESVAAASDALRADVRAARELPEHVVLIMVESLGQFADSALHDFVWQPFNDAALHARYDVRQGSVPFRGGTTSGELRELCAIYADYITLPTRVMPDCLSNQLRRLGYHTVSLHGYKDSYYNRGRWYPMLFQQSLFEDDFSDVAGDRRCGTQFRGVCDRDAFTSFEREARTPGQRFIYWLTLDAHTPVDMERAAEFGLAGEPGGRGAGGPGSVCGSADVEADAPEVCLIAAFTHDLFERIAVLAADPTLPRTRFVVVGDHAPAFVRRSRAAYFAPGEVPFIELIPR